jgi:hypothetical protein
VKIDVMRDLAHQLWRRVSEDDPWLFDSRRLVASGEVDCVVWISAYSNEAPPWSPIRSP